MSGDLLDEADDFEVEGVEAFNRMTAAMDRLGTTLADEEAEASTARKAAQDAKEAAQTALQAARASARSVASWAVLGALAGVLGAGGAGYWLGHASGRENGLLDGYKAARDEKAAAAWANTPAGQLALDLDKTGSLSVLARCTAPNWKAETRDGARFCFPMLDAKQNVTGWRIP